MSTEKESLLKLRDKLKQLSTHKENNMLDFMDWESYEKQNDMRVKVLDRLLYNKGDKKIFVVFGGNRCLGKNQKIYDPVKNKSIAVSEIDGDFNVCSYDGSHKVISKACKPFIKGHLNIYRVTFKNGTQIEVSDTHLLLASSGKYLPVSQLQNGDGVFHHQSILESFLLNLLPNVLNLRSISLGFLNGCRPFFRLCGERLHAFQESYRYFQTSQDDVQVHSIYEDDVPSGGFSCRQGCIHSYQSGNRPSIQGAHHQSEAQHDASLYQVFCKSLKLVGCCTLFLPLLFLRLLRHALFWLCNQLARLFLFLFSLNITSRTIITKVNLIGKSEVWDFEVPVYNNYFIEGIVNHNSGKTELGAGIVAEYLEKSPNAQVMCSTVDYKLSVVVQQTKVNKLIRNRNVSYGQFNPARGYTNDTFIMKNNSKCLFRSYQQGREAVQGMDLDLIWWDEEGPWSYFQECLARLTDRDGVFLLTFTSLSGFTRLVNFLWESENKLIETTVLSILDNPFIPQSAKDNYLLTVDPDEVQTRVHGKPHLREGLIYKSFGEIHKIDPFDHVEFARANPQRYQLHEGIDPHERTPHHWIRFLYDSQENIIYICDELKAPVESMIIADFSRLIKLKRGSDKRGVIKPAYCQIDTSSNKPDVIYKHPDEDQEDAHTIRLEFFRNGIETILCTKDNAIGIGEVKKRLKVVKTNAGVVKRPPMIYVFKTCTGVIWEFNRYSWDSYSSDKISERKELINKPMKKNDHYMDVVKYEVLKMRNDYGSVEEEVKFEEQYEGMGY